MIAACWENQPYVEERSLLNNAQVAQSDLILASAKDEEDARDEEKRRILRRDGRGRNA